MGVWYTPSALFGTPPLFARTIFAALCPALRPATERSKHGAPHQIATSGVVSRTVGQMVKRSMAPRAVVLVGVPAGSASKYRMRSAAFSKVPHSRNICRLPVVRAVLSRAISWRMSGSAWVQEAADLSIS